ncbi:metal-dependent hydrolase family protein [Methylobacterium planeticum]|uniref:Amidohydrolase family protein n=1 Tax=Methylobacterium planeticum TaxID=2615211 RepID=A0A6N6MTY4_9HYPH|nr:amidohydrolase family protein [Methylobacterium planeticum]KAB1074097.1 amidohydrolase family protein [Methylobacterium planeticum]
MLSCTSGDEAVPAHDSGCLCHRPEIRSLTRRLGTNLSRRGFVTGIAAAVSAAGLPSGGVAQPAPVPPQVPILFTNARVFDGRSDALREGLQVLVEKDRVKALASGNHPAPDGARVIDCGNRVLMPGLIDAHWHCLFAGLPLASALTADLGYVFLAAAAEARRTLMRGFTTVRDLGGPAFPLQQAIDQGLATGPRIYPSGAMLTTTGGHGDMRPLSDLPRSVGGPVSALERTGAAAIADAAAELRLRAREQLLQGASQIKVVGGGGVSTPRSPLDMTTFGLDDLRAAVAVAEDWNTYVAVHAYTPRTVQRAIAAGARCIEHAHLMDDATAALMAEKDIWLSIQPFLGEEDSAPLTGPSRAKMQQVFAGTDTAYRLAKAHGVKTAFGSDLLFSDTLTARQGTMLTHLTHWYGNAEILRMATSGNAGLLALSGPRNPYPGKLGVVEDGALADLLLVDGNPVADITLVADPAKNFLMIMKAGVLYKDVLGP